MILSFILTLFSLHSVWLIPLDKPKLFEGDMLFSNDVNLRTLAYIGGSKWPNGILPWKVNNGVFTSTELKIITDAISDLENKVNADGKKHIQIVPHTNELNWVQIIRDSGCYSYVGLINRGAQDLSLGFGCVFTGIIQHEFLHALGFFHEQSRPDRNDYVIVNFTNIISGYESNFNRYSTFVDFFGLPYDYDSIMHYGPYAFSKNNLPTITPKNKSAVIGNREKMSNYDIEAVRLHYPTNVSAITTTSPITTSITATSRPTTTTRTTTTSRSTTTTRTTTTSRSTTTTRTTTTSRPTTTKTRRRQKSKVKRSIEIRIDLNKFNNDNEYKNNLTSLLKKKIIKQLQSISGFSDIIDFVLISLTGRKRQTSATVVDQYTLVLDTAVQRDVKGEILQAASQIANDLSEEFEISANNNPDVETIMENGSTVFTPSRVPLLFIVLFTYFFNIKF